MTAEEAHKLGMTYEQSIRANEKNQIFVAKVLSSNKELGVEEIKAFTALQKTLMSQDFVTNILDDKNVNLSQLIGLDANQVKKILSSGSDKDRLDFMNRVVQSGAYNEIPALKRMMEDLGFDAQSLNVLSKQGGLKIDDDSIKKITDAQNKDFSEINDVLLSSGSKINEEIRARISMLSAEGIKDENGKWTDFGIQQKEALKEFNTMEKLIREDVIRGNDEAKREQLKRAKELYNLIKDYSTGNKEAIEKFSNLSDKDRLLAEQILVASDKSEKLVKDQIQVSQTLSEAQDLGLDKALSGGGLSGLFSGLLDVGLKSAYSPEYQKKLESFMGNIKKSIEPAVNIFKELLIDPIIDSLKNNIGMLLGEILVGVKGIWRKMTKSEYSDEEKQLDRTRFLRTTDVIKDMEDINKGEHSVGNYSEDYREALLKADSLTMSDVDKYNLSSEENAGLKNYVAQNSKAMNTGGRLLGTTEIDDIDLSTSLQQKQVGAALSNVKINFKEGKGDFNEQARSLEEYLQNSTSIFGTDAYKILRFLATDPSIDYKTLEDTYETLESKFKGQYYPIMQMLGIKKLTDLKALRAYISYLLLKSNTDLFYDITKGYYGVSIVPHNKKADFHYQFKQRGKDDIEYYANGGIVAATAGGKQVTVGEAGHDEIILPTDPAKQARAQYLLQQAQEKYGLYANNPDEASAKLKEQMSELLFDLRILMIQLDPMRDITAMRSVMSAFGLLKNASVIANPDAATDANQPEELIGEGLPKLGEPIKDAANLGSIRAAIINEAKKYTGTPYALAPAGLVCNQLVNAAYAGVLGKKNYAEMLRTLGYAHDEMHTISGFIPEIRKGSSDKVLLASSVEYSSLSSLAKPGDLVFSSNTGKTPNGLNPDNHGHVNLFIDKDSKIDSTSMKINGKDGVGVHKPYKGKHMLMNLLDNMPESWYVEKGLLKPDSSSERNIIGLNADGTPIYADNANMSSYDPSLQSTPNASYVSDQVNRADQAKIEKERRNAEKQNRTAVEQIREVINNLGIKMTHMDMQRQMSVSVAPDKTFCTSGMSSSSGMCYGIG
jgi:cell wall-associated NlpC family hydrolase